MNYANFFDEILLRSPVQSVKGPSDQYAIRVVRSIRVLIRVSSFKLF
jgi:hypothetical protein